LIKYLQAESYDKVLMGLKTAASLIRRKASFGTELSDHAINLAKILIGLHDTYAMENFQEMRQAALTALVASAPNEAVPYFIDVFFTGDVSMQQRCVLLSVMGIGARELAGLEQKVVISNVEFM
jgi:telomere length regulation protein